MSESLDNPLTSTLSIRQGMSVGRLVTDVAEAYGVPVTPELTQVLHGVNNLYTHADSRLDGDKRNSHPERDVEGRVMSGTQLPWGGYLSHLYGEKRLLADPQLTGEQRTAVDGLRASFDRLDLPEEQRRHFAHRFQTWIAASEYAKSAAGLYGTGGYVRGRTWEGRELANVFAAAFPLEAQTQPNFARFRSMLGRLIGGYKLFDSMLDLPKDIEHRNSSVRSARFGRIALIMPMGYQGLSVALRRPSLVPKMVKKALVARANASNVHNPRRTRE